jgi:hypothetical protein
LRFADICFPAFAQLSCYLLVLLARVCYVKNRTSAIGGLSHLFVKKRKEMTRLRSSLGFKTLERWT